ncbi:unnamed protein product [Rangifer tarandus platyrhynchus]|uniref:Uncharacterized protein n=1 Tax=Rangifer tarandus platyrhynchus TaxID=3082113 RepID=A0ABN8XMW0_RANTA|nr:unnamed protein product [Rangifer tarandus platyrhynchus]
MTVSPLQETNLLTSYAVRAGDFLFDYFVYGTETSDRAHVNLFLTNNPFQSSYSLLPSFFSSVAAESYASVGGSRGFCGSTFVKSAPSVTRTALCTHSIPSSRMCRRNVHRGFERREASQQRQQLAETQLEDKQSHGRDGRGGQRQGQRRPHCLLETLRKASVAGVKFHRVRLEGSYKRVRLCR